MIENRAARIGDRLHIITTYMSVSGQKVLSLERLEPEAVAAPEHLTNVINLTLMATGNHGFRGETRLIERESNKPIAVAHIVRLEPSEKHE